MNSISINPSSSMPTKEPRYRLEQSSIKKIEEISRTRESIPNPGERGPTKSLVTIELIRMAHRQTFAKTNGLEKNAGRLKQIDVGIRVDGYAVDTLPKDKVIPFLESLCMRFNERLHSVETNADSSRIVVVAEFLLDFLAIHPFKDGNGRTARLLSAYLLERLGYRFASLYPIDVVIDERREEYYRSLFLGQQHWYSDNEDISAWVVFYVDAVYEQLQRCSRRYRCG